MKLQIRIVGIDNGVGIGFKQEHGLGCVQLLLRTGKGHHAVDGAAAPLNAHSTEGQLLRLSLRGLLCDGRHRLGCLRLRRRGHRNAA